MVLLVIICSSYLPQNRCFLSAFKHTLYDIIFYSLILIHNELFVIDWCGGAGEGTTHWRSTEANWTTKHHQEWFMRGLSNVCYDFRAFIWCPVWVGGYPPYPFTSPPSTLSFSIFYFSFFPYLLHLFSCFSIPSHSTRIVPLHFQAGCHRRWLNLALFFCMFVLCYVYFLVMVACLFLSYLI